jgi:hypothetical protein
VLLYDARCAGVAIGKIQLGVASGGSAKLADPPEAAVPVAAALGEDPPLVPEPLLQALTASVAATPSAARAAGAERADLNTFLMFLQVLRRGATTP